MVRLGSMAVTVSTARITYGGPGRLDITRRHANDCNAEGCSSLGQSFAPSKKLWAALHSKEITPAAYLKAYRHDQERLQRRTVIEAFEAVFDGVVDDDRRVVGVCFCPDPSGCHRTVWREVMVGTFGYVDGGELPAEEQRSVAKAVRWSGQGRLF